MVADMVGVERVAAIPTTALDPPHSAASPAVPALIGSGSPSTVECSGRVSTRGPRGRAFACSHPALERDAGDYPPVGRSRADHCWEGALRCAQRASRAHRLAASDYRIAGPLPAVPWQTCLTDASAGIRGAGFRWDPAWATGSGIFGTYRQAIDPAVW